MAGWVGFLEAVRQTIGRFRMFTPGDRVAVAVSGGPDSMALLHVLWTLRDELGISLLAAHMNHLLRGEESFADADFVRTTAAGLGLPVTVENVAVAELARRRGLSIEEAGREARYQFYSRILAASGADKVALAHTADDQAETVLMRFLRGAGPAGLAGIPPIRDGWVVRPLLYVRRSEVEGYCRQVGLSPRYDPSNRDPAFLRNRLRWDLLPRLEREFNPALRRALVHLADVLWEEESWLAALVEERYRELATETPEGLRFPVDALLREPPALRRRLLRAAATHLTGRFAALDFDHVEAVTNLLTAPTGARVDLPGGLAAYREYGFLFFVHREKLQPGMPGGGFAYHLPVPGSVEVPEAGLVVEAAIDPAGEEGAPQPGLSQDFDADRVSLPLIVRSRRPGDRLGAAGVGRKVKEYFIRKKIPRRERESIPLLVGADGAVLWIIGHKHAGEFAFSPESRSRLRIRVWPAKS